jgi:hypothetical protein
VFEPFETLVNQYIVNHKITQTVKHNSQTYEEFVIQTSINSIVKCYTWGGKITKDIVSFKNISIFWLVVIGMEIPHEPCITYLWVHHALIPLSTLKKDRRLICLRGEQFFAKRPIWYGSVMRQHRTTDFPPLNFWLLTIFDMQATQQVTISWLARLLQFVMCFRWWSSERTRFKPGVISFSKCTFEADRIARTL